MTAPHHNGKKQTGKSRFFYASFPPRFPPRFPKPYPRLTRSIVRIAPRPSMPKVSADSVSMSSAG